jgi:hypothetical protein
MLRHVNWQMTDGLKEVIYQSKQGCIPLDWTLSDNHVNLLIKLNLASFPTRFNQRGRGNGKAEHKAEMRNAWNILVGNTKGKGVLKDSGEV